MAELFVRTVDKVNPDSAKLDAECTKRGDVIVICPDGWQWGSAERNSAEHVIIQVPGVAVDALSALTASEPADAAKPTKLLQRRALTFNLDEWEKSYKGKKTLDSKAVDALKTVKPIKEDKDILGGEPKDVLG